MKTVSWKELDSYVSMRTPYYPERNYIEMAGILQDGLDVKSMVPDSIVGLAGKIESESKDVFRSCSVNALQTPPNIPNPRKPEYKYVSSINVLSDGGRIGSATIRFRHQKGYEEGKAKLVLGHGTIYLDLVLPLNDMTDPSKKVIEACWGNIKSFEYDGRSEDGTYILKTHGSNTLYGGYKVLEEMGLKLPRKPTQNIFNKLLGV